MNKKAVIFHSVIWIAAYFFWLFFTKANHPTWPLRIICTFMLVGASATYSCFFVPTSLEYRRIVASIFALIVIGVLTAVVIHFIYDALLGPDPRRFSLVSNIWMDTLFVLVNTLVAGLLAWLASAVFGKKVWRLFKLRGVGH